MSMKAALRIASFSTVLVALASGCTRCSGPGSSQKEVPPAPSTPVPAAKVLPTVNELVIEDLKPGKGAEAKSGKFVTVHYVGTLMDGSKFDSSRDRNEPFGFILGAGQVIPGWDQGVAGMKKGGLRRLKIPSKLAYGEQGAGNVIPPNASLVFEVELIDVKESTRGH